MNIKHLCIIIPAKNEEQLLPRCLRSILEACKNIPDSISVDIILCVNDSTDATFQIGQQMINRRGVVIEKNHTNVGMARKYATQKALKRYTGPLEECWLANTDADCEVPLNWLTTHLFWASQGIDAITGIVVVDSYREHDSQVAELFQNQYIINEDCSHPHIHGANLGIRADVYKKIGGWNNLATAEDHDLWSRLKKFDFNLISHSTLWVTTSGRKQGRAPHGFAGKLASYNGKQNEQNSQ